MARGAMQKRKKKREEKDRIRADEGVGCNKDLLNDN